MITPNISVIPKANAIKSTLYLFIYYMIYDTTKCHTYYN